MHEQAVARESFAVMDANAGSASAALQVSSAARDGVAEAAEDSIEHGTYVVTAAPSLYVDSCTLVTVVIGPLKSCQT